MKNKKTVMAFSGLLILVFHLWINVTQSMPEMFIKQIAYIGVDIFFFISAYSLAGREPNTYFGFVLSRFKSVYLRYILFAVVGAIYSHWSIIRLAKVICGIELFEKGGGAFLWFLPAIMLFYILYPALAFFHKKNPIVTLICSLAIWAVIAALLTYIVGYNKIFIMINRIPVFLLGFYIRKYKIIDILSQRPIMQLTSGVALTCLGLVLLFYTGFTNKLAFPFTDMFYVCAIPASIGLILLVSFIPETRFVKLIGNSTLELYAIQMIFGYKLANLILKKTGNISLTNILVLIIVVSLSIVISILYGKIVKTISQKS